MENGKTYTQGVVDALGIADVPEGCWIDKVDNGIIKICYESNGCMGGSMYDAVMAWANNCRYHMIGGGYNGAGVYDISLKKDDNKEGCKTGDSKSNICHVEAEIRYTEDCKVNGVIEPDCIEHKDAVPKIFGAVKNEDTGMWDWAFDVQVDTGKIINWPEGMEAVTYYKVCDGFMATFNGMVYGPDYVPDCFCLDEEGYGDYMYLTIGKDGIIKNWNKNNRWLRFVKKMESERR